MDKQIKDIIGLFHKEEVLRYEVKEIWNEDDDSRWIIFVDLPKEKFVIKIAANDFTSVERVNGWVKIIAAYHDLGYYSPAIMKSRNGSYAEYVMFHSKSCVVYEEEYAKYHLRSTLKQSAYIDESGKYVYHNDVLAFLGKIAQKHYDFFPYKSGWVRFEPFGSSESADEITDCVATFDTLVREKVPEHIPRWEKILALFEKNKKQIEEIYPSLPTSVFQGDHFDDNLLLDDDGHFKGVIDYNLAGTDTVINVFLYTVLFGYHYDHSQPDSADLLPEYNPVKQDFMIQSILDAFKYLRKFYAFNEDELRAVLPLYKYISCIEYKQIRALKKYQSDTRKLNLLFDAMEHELLRKDSWFYNECCDGNSKSENRNSDREG